MSKLTLRDMVQHVVDVATSKDILIEWTNGRSAWASHECEEIIIPRIRGPVSYAVALHEIGHVLGSHQRSKRRIVRERWAWHWAKRHAKQWTPAMERCMRSSLEWYEMRHAQVKPRKAA